MSVGQIRKPTGEGPAVGLLAPGSVPEKRHRGLERLKDHALWPYVDEYFP